MAYPKAARALRDGGSLALFWNVHVHSDASEGYLTTLYVAKRK